MTEAEIEKQADKYLIKFWCKNNTVDILPIKTAWDLRGLLIDVIKYVLSEGRKDAIEWHDLRKAPNDLPKAGCLIVSMYHDGTYSPVHFYLGGRFNDDVIKWCELPQFKDKE